MGTATDKSTVRTNDSTIDYRDYDSMIIIIVVDGELSIVDGGGLLVEWSVWWPCRW